MNTHQQLELPLPELAPTLRRPLHPHGPGRIAAGQTVTCLPGALPAREGGRGMGILRSVGIVTSLVDVYGGRQRRIRNDLLHPQAGPWIASHRSSQGLRTTDASGRAWLPGWSWLGWNVAENLEYRAGTRRLPEPPPAPPALVIIACGARKAACISAPAGQMYTGSYHRAARRAADTVAAGTPGAVIMILSARYGLLRLNDEILRYNMRLDQRGAITAQGLREQAEQLGVLTTAAVTAIVPEGYRRLACAVWPSVSTPLVGSRGIGEQMERLAALASARTP